LIGLCDSWDDTYCETCMIITWMVNMCEANCSTIRIQ